MTEKEKKQTCLQCRKRKVRCDGELNGCSNCERLDFSCVFVSSSNTTPSSASISNADLFLKNAPQECATGGPTSRTKYTIGGIERRRGLRACRPCRASKSRCSGSLPTCRQCERRGLDCQYAPSKRRKNPSETIPVAAEITHTSTQMLQSDDRHLIYPARSVNGIHMGLSGDRLFVESHIDAYFEFFNAIPQYSFIHKPSFMRSFHQNTLDPLLLRCICGIASRFIQPGLQQGYVADWLKEVEAQVWPKLSEMKVGNLQILLSLICWYSVERKVSNLWTASAMAARIAYGLRLNHEASDKIPFILKETRRRLVWSIFMLDKLYAGGFPELTLCPANTLHVKLPCEEQNFELDIPVETSLLVRSGPFSEESQESGIGIMGYIARLMSIRHAILELTKQIISSKIDPYSARDEIQNLDNMLSDFALGLPAHLREETKNLLSRAYSSGLTGYINLHTLWHQCYCDLYRLMIPGIRESVTEEVQQQVPVEYANECRRRCLSHAIGICKLWSETLREGDLSRISDQSIGIYAYQCANVLVNLWDLDHDNALKSSLQTIASFLNRLVLIYPVVAEIQSEIKQLISSLDVVTDFYRTHTPEFLNQSLTSAWRSTLRQQGVQGGQTTSRFSLLEFLQNQNRSEDSAEAEYTPATVDPEPCLPTPIDHTEALNMVELAPNADVSDISAEFWSSTPLDMDFGSCETRVDPFYRIFDDWALTALS